ncbi:cryptochrome/photolyase family protein [Phytohabitans rumicis]|uniref:Cryptochrome/photolyase family protein n=1 Tax=Phytohabitans rumicis TaxID=1076125 RepID=A0A6V8LDA9_9ACTN|nr:cryptochrome/photolyase family protein [Phytohabitans rumicis]GFJ92007.1 hypothetical protein Prum_056490 [Phytohabitans rumicis]
MRRWLFADQLGPHFLDEPDQPVLLIESKAVFRRRAFHRQKAHLVLSALRHRAAELGGRAVHIKAETYGEGLRRLGEVVEVSAPTSRRARDFVRVQPKVTMLPARGFLTDQDDFAAWADRRRGGMRLDDFYRQARRQHGVLMDGDEPASGRWLIRRPPVRRPPTGLSPPPAPVEDDIDAEVRDDLDRWAAEGIEFAGRDGPRAFPATRREALDREDHFVAERLPRYEGMPSADPWVTHSGLSSALTLGLLDPLPVVRRAERSYRDGQVPLSSVELFARQVLGWRDYLWHLYWYFNTGDPGRTRASGRSIPTWFTELDPAAVPALAGVRDHAWLPYADRDTVLAQPWRRRDLVDWLTRHLVDAQEWSIPVGIPR